MVSQIKRREANAICESVSVWHRTRQHITNGSSLLYTSTEISTGNSQTETRRIFPSKVYVFMCHF